ncbi:MAG: PilZ domain-containing protein [Thermodesulfobacteriota bacterium]
MGRQERRASTRVHFSTTASLHFTQGDYPDCETGNLSVKGVFVRGVSGRNIGDGCSVELHLSGSSSDLVLRMQGEVARVQADGVGIKFSEIDLDSFYHLKNIIYYNSDHAEEAGATRAAGPRDSEFDGFE